MGLIAFPPLSSFDSSFQGTVKAIRNPLPQQSFILHTHTNTHFLFHTSKAILKREEESKSNANAFCPSPHGMTLLVGVGGPLDTGV